MQFNSIVIFPGNDRVNTLTDAGSEQVPIRKAYDFDRFATTLSRHASATVQVTDELVLPEPGDGVIFVCRPDVLERSLPLHDRVHLLSSRTVVAGLVRTYALEWAERLALAAVIPSEQYFHWQEGLTRPDTPRFYGLKSVGQALGADWLESAPMQSANYALLRHGSFHDLPEFLAAYLTAYVPQL